MAFLIVKLLLELPLWKKPNEKDDGTWMHAGYSTSYHNLKPQIESGQLIEYFDPLLKFHTQLTPKEQGLYLMITVGLFMRKLILLNKMVLRE